MNSMENTIMLPIRPLRDDVYIDIVDRNITKKDLGGGKILHLIADDSFSGPHDPVTGGKHSGIRPRWARVLGLGPDVEDDIEIGDLVLCDALKWSRRIPLGRDGQEIVYFWNINVADILVVDDDTYNKVYLWEFKEKLERLTLTIGHL
jgi:hypothetical protein